MDKNKKNLAALASLAHRALNSGDTEYARNKALIAQFFVAGCAAAQKEEVRLTLIDSLYSTNVASRRLFGIADIAQKLRGAFKNGDTEVKKQAALWIEKDFDSANPLYALFAADYGLSKDGGEGKAAVSLLSKYLYFATDYAFPIYDALGADYYYLADKKSAPDFQKRFRALREIKNENSIASFDLVDNFFWLYGKVDTGSFSLVLNKKRYAALTEYRRDKTISALISAIRSGKNNSALQKIIGVNLYGFIQKTARWDKE
jgi:hypothetical protein